MRGKFSRGKVHSKCFSWHLFGIILQRFMPPCIEVQSTSPVPDGQGGLATVFFDIVSGHAIDQYNKPLQFISSPNENLIQIYRDKVRYSQPPACLIENGIMYLPGAPHIIFSNETDHWINRVTKRIISGLSAPSRSQI
jgi:hypothetical protein